MAQNDTTEYSQNIETLTDLKNSLDSPATDTLAAAARIPDPSAAVSNAITSFVTNKLEKLSRDDEFADLIKMHIRQRLPEASFEELMKLNHDVNIDNTKATEAVLGLFKGDNSEKTIIDTLKGSGVASKAQELYDSTDNKDVLQAVTYLSQVLGKLQTTNMDLKKVN